MDRRRGRAIAIGAVKAAVGAAVLLMVGRHVAKTWHDFRANGRTLHVEPAWMVAASACYLAGLGAFGLYFGRVLESSPAPVGRGAALRAYLISHLGKYVPGKAMVVLMRVTLLSNFGGRATTVTFASFYETLVMMAAGGLIGAIGFAPRADQRLPAVASLGLGLVFLAVATPTVFGRLSRLASVPFPRVAADAMPSLSNRLLGEGLLWAVGGWTLLGLSQVCVALGLSDAPIDVRLWPAIVASVALATVAGFAVAVLPGGLGVREGVLMATLAPAIGAEPAVAASLALRLTWVAGEIAVAAALALVRPTPIPSSTPDPADHDQHRDPDPE